MRRESSTMNPHLLSQARSRKGHAIFPALTALLALMLPASIASCSRHETTGIPIEAAPPLAAQVIEATARPWESGLEVTGGVEPFRRATPGTILMGRVDQILRREGDRVRAGETLARIESRDVAARLAQAESAVAAASANEENARLMKERMERLFDRQAAPQRSVDDARAGHSAALAALHAAEQGVEAARMYVAYTEVTAPFSGIIAQRNIEAGDMAAPGQPLFVVEETSRMKIEAQVPESAVRGLRKGVPVEVVIEGAPSADQEGRLDEILPAGDPRSRTFTVRVVIDNPSGEIRTGTFARLRFAGGAETRLAVPRSAVVRRGPLTGLFVVEPEGKARLRWVSLGVERDGWIEILSGLAVGERIVAEPPVDLEDGRTIEVM